MTQQPERDALEAAARAIHDRYEAMTHWVKTLKNEPRQFEESSIRDVHRQDAQVAINAYLSALSAQGMRVMPREPTPAMHVRGMDCRRVQDNLNKVHSVIIDTSEIWREMFDAAYGGAK